MKKADELSSPTSCLNRSKDDEWIFVLKSTDRHAPATVQFWATLRQLETRGKDIVPGPTMVKIEEALQCATEMTHWRSFYGSDGRTLLLVEAVMNVAEAILRRRGICEVSFVTTESADTDEQHFAKPNEAASVQLTLFGEAEDGAPVPMDLKPSLIEAVFAAPVPPST